MLEVKLPSPVNQPATVSVKRAMSVDKDFDPFLITLEELVEKHPFLADRPECETDTSAVQLIPYITLVDDSGLALKYFVYTRGQASGEKRLAGKCSVGLGGHIEEIEKTDTLPNCIINSVCMTAVREIEEEIGLTIPFHIFANALSSGYADCTEQTDNTMYIAGAKLLYNCLTPTDTVHLGISFVLKAKQSDILNTELDVITRGRWMTYEEIVDAETQASPICLEVWSKAVIARVDAHSKKTTD